MTTGKITKRSVDAAAAGPSDVFIWDEALKGFGLKITKGGVKTYLVQYRMGGRGSATKRHTIGRHGSPWTASTAREEAERFLSQVARGTDPKTVEAERRRKGATLEFDDYLERYLREYGMKRWRSSTYPTVASNLHRYVLPVIGRKSLPDVTRSDLIAIFDGLPPDKPALPRNVHAHASRLFSWAVERGDIERSPFESLRTPPAVASRDRVLSDEELHDLWRASTIIGYPFGPMLRMLILTGQRRSEVAEARWNEFNRRLAEWTIPAERAKNKSAHIVPLAPSSVEALDDLAGGSTWPQFGFVFTTTSKTGASGHSRAKDRIDKELAKLAPGRIRPPWRIHDLRRTLATGFQRLGIRFEVTEAVLNHVSGARSGVAGVYQRHNWREEKRTALERWSSHIANLSDRASD